MAPELAVVLDVNVYIYAADELKRVAGQFPDPWVPPSQDWHLASLQTISALGGNCAPVEFASMVSLYTSDKELNLVERKLGQPVNAQRVEDRGLGWTPAEIGQWLNLVIDELANIGQFSSFGPTPARRLSSVGYEDECVYGVLMRAKDEDALCTPILVTADRPFLSEVNADAPIGISGSPLWMALTPTDFLNYLRT